MPDHKQKENAQKQMRAESKIVITEHIATIATRRYADIEVNLCSKGGKAALFDIRYWKKSDRTPLGGVSLFPDEVERLRDLLNEITLVEDLAVKG